MKNNLPIGVKSCKIYKDPKTLQVNYSELTRLLIRLTEEGYYYGLSQKIKRDAREYYVINAVKTKIQFRVLTEALVGHKFLILDTLNNKSHLALPHPYKTVKDFNYKARVERYFETPIYTIEIP